MSYSEVQGHIENIITGKHYVNNRVSEGRFVILNEEHGQNASRFNPERRVKISIGSRRQHFPTNYKDGHGHYIHKLTISIFYALTNSGLDNEEGTTPEQGAGTVEAIELRALDDVAAIENALLHDKANWSGTEPEIYNIQPTDDGNDLEIDEENKIAKQTKIYNLYLKTIIPSSS